MKEVQVLSGLIEMMFERIKGYTNAADCATDVDLKIVFTRFANQSRYFKNQLIDYCAEWNDQSQKFTGQFNAMRTNLENSSRKESLSNCEEIERATLDAYNKALEYKCSLEIMSAIRMQRSSISDGREMIAAMFKQSK